ncbi:MAG: hypothetical protein R3A12_17980 [Ignavibacteria bacterium]
MPTIELNKLINFRKHLHSIPELSNNEKLTSPGYHGILSSCKPTELLSDVGGFGIIATWDSGQFGKKLFSDPSLMRYLLKS